MSFCLVLVVGFIVGFFVCCVMVVALREDTLSQQERLEWDILEHGIRQPLFVTRDGLILNGWRRYKVARKLGLKDVPVVVFEGDVEQMSLDQLVPPYASVGDE